MLREIEQTKSIKRKVELLNKVSWVYYEFSLDSMFYYANKSLEYNQNVSKKELATSYNYLGIYYESKAKSNKALDYYLKALDVQKKNNDSLGLSFTYTNIGLFYYYQQDYEKAIPEIEKSLKINKALKDSLAMANDYQTIGMLYTYVDEVGSEKSIELYQKAEEIYKIYKEDYYLMSIYINMAKIFFEDKDYQKAEEYYDLAEKIANEKTNIQELRAIYMGKSMIYSEKNDFPKAIKFIHKSITFAKIRGNLSILMYNYDYISRLYEKNNQFDSALFYLKKYNSIKDSTFTIETNKKIAEINIKYETEKKEKEVLMSKLEIGKVKRENAKTKSNYKRLSVFFFMLIFMLIGFVLLYYNKIKHNQILADKNEIISKNLEEKEILLGEIHHRVKNNLQLVSTMLMFQEEGIEDERYIRILRESRNRIQAMALIHQELYSHDDLRSINMDEYLKRLIEKLLMAYSVDDVEVDFQIDNIKINIDTAIPIALIVNELFTNSVKYAFKGIEEPTIELYLKEKDEILQLIFSDNGIGFNFKTKKESFGSKLVNSFCRQLKAEMSVNSTSKGTITIINIKRYERIS